MASRVRSGETTTTPPNPTHVSYQAAIVSGVENAPER